VSRKSAGNRNSVLTVSGLRGLCSSSVSTNNKEDVNMRKLNVATLITLDGVIQDPGGFGETQQGGWGNPYFTEAAQKEAHDHLMASDYFLCGRITYELMSRAWGKIKGGAYLERMNAIPKLVASRTLTGPLGWNATVIQGDVAEAIAGLKRTPGKDIEMYGSASLMQTLMKHDLIDEYRMWVHPFVLGSGKRLFPDSGQPAKLQLVSARSLDSGVVILSYHPAR
jgi:dihydrofolate reductase